MIKYKDLKRYKKLIPLVITILITSITKKYDWLWTAYFLVLVVDLIMLINDIRNAIYFIADDVFKLRKKMFEIAECEDKPNVHEDMSQVQD